MTYPIKSPKKLIEVALPLDAINAAAAREKSIRHGHPSTLHLWWARRPLAAARAVIFSQMVNDPSWKWEMEHPGEIPPSHLKASWAASRKRLFKIIEDLVLWENTTNESVLERARVEIRKSWVEVCDLNKEHPQAAELFNPDKLPAFHDPFAGGGALPLEAQRLGLESYASDLNPVAVLINKAMIEIPPKFAGRSPVGPIPKEDKQRSFQSAWPGSTGLAEDVRRYGAWMRDEAFKRIGHLYPKVQLPKEHGGGEATVIAWLWARTVKSPNPAFSHVEVPLATSFVLSSKEGKEAYVEPEINGDSYSFNVKIGKTSATAKLGTKLARGSFKCLLSDAVISYTYIDNEANSGRMGARLLAVVAEGDRGRVWLSPTDEIEQIALSAKPVYKPDAPTWGTGGSNAIGRRYGFHVFGDYFTARQLVLLTTLSDLVLETRKRVRDDALAAGMDSDDISLSMDGCGATAYADGVAVYLSFIVDQVANHSASVCGWNSANTQMRSVFARQVIPMTWDYAECNAFSDSSGSYNNMLERQIKGFASLGWGKSGKAVVADAGSQTISNLKIISTDPPYYDNIAYADLSDFFYVWLRPTLKLIFPNLFVTMSTPKTGELVALPYRHSNRVEAGNYFLNGMTQALRLLSSQTHPGFPITIYYAFKQSDTESEGTSSTGWDTFLEAVIQSGFALSGTWPMRTEKEGRVTGYENNALASSIILVCRKRDADAITISRREFMRELNAVLPEALDEMTKGTADEISPVAPVDLSQSIIGPGMAIFSKYAAVLEADGSSMTVRTALQLINRFLAEDDFDPDTQFCLHWFEQNGWNAGKFGDADTLSRAKGTAVAGVAAAGVVESGSGNVRLLKWSEYPEGWDPTTDTRNPVWETLHHLIRSLKQDGESGAGKLLAETKNQGEAVRQLAYRLYTLCERKGWAEDARAYNELITSWSGVESAASDAPRRPTQGDLF